MSPHPVVTPTIHTTISRKELALLYFPTATPRVASAHLSSWISRCKGLRAALDEAGYLPRQRMFTPKQARLFARFLGEP